MTDVKIYGASKVRHASLWLAAKQNGYNIISTWIYEAGAGQSKSLKELSERCIQEVKDSDVVIVFAEPNDKLKGAFIEMGVALAFYKPVFYVGELTGAFSHHPLVIKFKNADAALSSCTREVVNFFSTQLSRESSTPNQTFTKEDINQKLFQFLTTLEIGFTPIEADELRNKFLLYLNQTKQS